VYFKNIHLRTSVEYSDGLSGEFAHNWSAATHRRFSISARAVLFLSLSMVGYNILLCQNAKASSPKNPSTWSVDDKYIIREIDMANSEIGGTIF